METNVVIDVVIPTYKPGERLLQILEKLKTQTLPVRGIHLVNTEKVYLDAFLTKKGMDEETLREKYPGLTITHLTRSEFDHGGARNLGVSQSEGAEYVLLMTQDALPEGNTLIEELVNPMRCDECLAASYARQLPNPGEKLAETYSRSFNYPDKSLVKSEADFPRLGIKTYFCSNVCAMYRMAVLEELHGFPQPMIFNEDMVFAGGALKDGYKIRYAAEARVFHSHHYSASQQFHRNFDLGVSQAMHPEIFAAASSEGEGVKYVKAVIGYLKDNHGAQEIPGFVISCGARLVGYRLGKKFQSLPRKMVLSCTSNPVFFKAHPEVFKK